MRLSEDKIKAGILHSDHDVRDAAAMYFSRSACRDPSILPLVIQAIEKYGWEQAFIVPPVAEGLPLSDETLPWVVKQLDSEDVRKDRTAFGRGWQGALVWLLCDADPNLLARHKSEIDGIKGLRKDDRTLIEMRVDLLNMKAESCWRELELIHGWLDTRPLQDVLPKSDFAEALRYIRNHWKELNVYVRDGRIPIDNNLVEQLMKQVAMGRKAWLFVCSVAGGEQSARMMTLVSSARRHDLDVRIYLKDVLDQLLAGCTDYHRLLPDVWKQSHREAVRQYRVEERRDKAERKQLEAARRRLAAHRLP